MTVLFFELHRTAYRSIPFLLNSIQTTQGRKTVTHEYPNQKARFVEDLGQNLRTFEVDGTLTGDILYSVEKRLLENTLNEAGIGIFRHPFLGDINVVVTSFSITEDMTTLGEASLKITFEESTANIFPKQAGDNISRINELVEDLSDIVDGYVANNFTTNYGDNIADASNVLGDFLTNVGQLGSRANTDQDDLNQFFGQIQQMTDNLFPIISNSTDLSSNLSNTLFLYDNLGTDASKRLDLNSNLFGFGSDQVDFPTDTTISIERQKNRDTLDGCINGKSLINAYNAAAQRTYLNDQELASTEEQLEANYQIFISDNNFTESMLADLEEIRNQVNIFFLNLKITVDKIITVITKPIALTVLTYQYYGNLDKREEILELNDIYDPSLLSGDVKILEQEA